MKKKLLATSLLCANLVFANASDITLDWLKDKPRTYAKDFYIWQFLKQDISSADAIDALGQARYVNNKLFFSYAKKLKHDETTAVIQCMRANANSLVNSNADCIEVGLNVYKMTKLNSTQLNTIYETLVNKYEDRAKVIDIIRAPIPFTKLISNSKDVFFNTFNECGSKFRTNYFNYKLPKKTLGRLHEDKRFNQTIKLIVTNTKLNQLQKSLLSIDDSKLNHLSSFLLAINALKHDRYQTALKYFDNAYEKAYYQFDKDKVNFWKYLSTKNKFYLYTILDSWDVNIYSLYAKEFFNAEIEKNIVFEVESNHTTFASEVYDISDPFFWIPILNNLNNFDDNKVSKYEDMLSEDYTLPHLAFMYERYHNYRKSYFITPYRKYLENYTLKRQALIYALGRQESRFIPSSISTAYAMGVMQIMPFLSKAIAKQLDENYDINDQLKPDVNLKYANFHLNYLEPQMKHPLLVAYAYNGGIGFTRRMLKNGLFNKKSQYKELEPFLSMELVPYNETRKYGKKVLANYYIYKNHLDKENKVTLKSLFETISK